MAKNTGKNMDNIKKATLENVAEINTLINLAYRGETSKKGWTTEANILAGIRTTETEIAEIISKTENNIFLYIENNIILGTVLLTKKANSLYLGMFTVNPELQNKGIGKLLLNYTNNYAESLKINTIEMTVITSRHELIAYYKRNGYVDTGKREPFPSEYNKDIIDGKPIEFMILEKNIENEN